MNKKNILFLLIFINTFSFSQEVKTLNGISPLRINYTLPTKPLLAVAYIQKRQFKLIPNEKIISLVFPDNKRLNVREQTARRCEFIKTALDDFNTENKTIILPAKMPLSQQSVKYFLRSLEDYNNLPTNSIEIKKVAQAADYLGAPDEYNQQLAKNYITYVNPVHFGPEAEHFYTYSGFKNYLKNRLKQLSKEERSRELDKVFGKNSLCLQGQGNNQISSLHDIIRIPLKYLDEKDIHKITEIDFSNNNLRTIHIDSLCQMFPKLKKLNLSHNNINCINLTQLDQMPNGFELNLLGNNIEHFTRSTRSTVPQECTVIVDAPYEPLIRHFKQTNNVIPKLLINCYAPIPLLAQLKISCGALSECSSLLSIASYAIPVGLQIIATATLLSKAIKPAIQSFDDLKAVEQGLQIRNFPLKKNYIKIPLAANGQKLMVVEDMKAKTTLLLMQIVSDLAKLKK